MKNVLLIMHRKILADALTRAMRDDERFQLFTEYDYSNALMTCQCAQAHVAVLEIPESGPWTPMSCFSLGDSLKERCPGLKLMILCPESSGTACTATVQARRQGRILYIMIPAGNILFPS